MDREERTEIEATALVPAPPGAVFEFLSDLRNHWLIAGRFVEVVSLDGSAGGRIRLRGPLGLRRTAATRVAAVHPGRLIVGTADVGPRTRARVSWELAARPGATRVRLAADVERAGSLDRLLLALGGSAWLRRRFAGTLERVVEIFAQRAEPSAGGEGARDAVREPRAALDRVPVDTVRRIRR